MDGFFDRRRLQREAGSSTRSGSPIPRRTTDLIAPDDGGSHHSSWWRRGASAIHRRARRKFVNQGPFAAGLAVEAAVDWLKLHQLPNGGFTPNGRPGDYCPGLTAQAAIVFSRLGEHEAATKCLTCLTALQRDDGALPDATGQGWSIYHTALALRAFLTLDDRAACDHGADHAFRAAQWLASSIGPDGRFAMPRQGQPLDRWAPATFLLTALPPLRYSVRRFGQEDWRIAADRATRRLVSQFHAAPLVGNDFVLICQLDALLELGWHDSALAVLRMLEATQHRDGLLHDLVNGRTLSARAMAHLAAVWYRARCHRPATRLMDWFRRHQSADGAIPARSPQTRSARPAEPCVWSTLHFLEAARLETFSSFSLPDAHAPLPDAVASHDGRLQAARQWAGTLPAGVRLAEVGCGSGRFLKYLHEWLPQASLTGIDPSRRLLARLPRTVQRRWGDLLNIPADDGSFDAVLCIEALEHSLLPQRAVDELCRVLRPGGTLLIIDKDRKYQPLSVCAPWERWFSPQELNRWLTPHCHTVNVRHVPHGTTANINDLFICATATRRRSTATKGTTVSRAA